MADRTYRGGRDRFERGYNRQAEQFDAADYGWRNDERSYGQMGDGWREEDYGQFETSGRERGREWGRDPSYSARGEFGRDTERSFGDASRRDTFTPRYNRGRGLDSSSIATGAGTQLAANHGEWREGYGVSPSRENRDYRGTWGGATGRDNDRGWLDKASDTVAGWFSDDDDDYGGRDRGYRGHGPSNYTRSDDRIMEDACDALTEDWGVDARQVTVSVNSGDVTLDGTVATREQKRRAEECVEDLSGVRNVQNNLRVQDRSEFSGSQSNPTSTQA